MNYGRLALAAVVAWVVDGVYGFIVYGNILAGQFSLYPDVFRPMESQATYMPVMFGGLLLAMFAATYIYAKGYEGGNGLQEGLRFGILIGLFVVGYDSIVNYAILNVGRRLGGAMALAALGEWVVAGVVIGLVYRPSSRAKTVAV